MNSNGAEVRAQLSFGLGTQIVRERAAGRRRGTGGQELADGSITRRALKRLDDRVAPFWTTDAVSRRLFRHRVRAVPALRFLKGLFHPVMVRYAVDSVSVRVGAKKCTPCGRVGQRSLPEGANRDGC